MGSRDYTDAVNSALDRLRATGFYLDHFFANHGPMAAEALAKLGFCEEVDGWVENNIQHRNYPRCRRRRSRSLIGKRHWAIANVAAIGWSCSAANSPKPRGEKCCRTGGQGYCRVAWARSRTA
ncbi:hypothetical protein [Mycobacterium xenopi]|uniref:hypothetical protein n=1 Tax=Mycobacterium xenopi TaxID=1789 RepID=UPI000D936415|nr:hypothetical protein [Mycobacterium xenopi]SPX88477.1 Uncharacterised protein [Mycobacterium xenopi]